MSINTSSEHKGFGTFKGVFVPSILTIFGVIMYLRLGWVVGNVGYFKTIIIVTLASSITFLTALSISSIATNARVGAGGAYFMISRAFGIEIGASIGLPLYFAQTMGIAFYIVGFAESFHHIFPFIPIPVAGTFCLIFLALVAYISSDLALKIQYLIFLIIILSLVSFFMGKPFQDNVEIFNNVSKVVPKDVNFWIVFAVFFPAVTGIEAGISMSGDLKKPSFSLPFGTLSAVFVGYIVYLTVPYFLSKYASEATLKTNFLIMKDIAKYQGFVIAGIWAASLSSALGALLGSPRTLQALARDKVLFGILGKGYGENNQPRIATVFSFFIALVAIWFGSIDIIAPILSMFFLTSYGFLNLAAGFEGLIANPSWRPKFKVPWYVSMFGALISFLIMFMINAGATIIAICFCIMVFAWMKRRNLGKKWEDISYSLYLLLARFGIYRLKKVKVDAKSWRPNVLVLTGSPSSRFYLVEFSDALTHGKGFLIIAGIFTKDLSGDQIASKEEAYEEFLKKRGIEALVEINTAENVLYGAKKLAQSYGLGPLVPNTFVLGETENEENFDDFLQLLRLLKSYKRNIIILRNFAAHLSNNGNNNGIIIKNFKFKQIDIWCRKGGQNSGLALSIAYMLQTSPEWSGAYVRLINVYQNEEEKFKIKNYFEQLLQRSRLNFKLEFIKSSANIYKLMREFSKTADLILCGLKHIDPQEEETTDYKYIYREVIKASAGIKNLAFIMANEEDVEFEKIFEL